MVVVFNNTSYPVVEGGVYTKTKNETLDSATIRLSHVDNIDIEPFDKCTLDGVHMCVDSYTRTQDGLDTNKYEYEIHLFSQTKLLENIILPSISITPRKVGTKRTIYSYLQQYLSEYGDSHWTLDNSIATKFNVSAPELQWNNPTLREVFNDLMMVKDCIVTLSNNVISYMDLTTKGNNIRAKSGINYITKSQSSDDYASDVRMQLSNVMQTTSQAINNTVVTTEYIPFSTDDYVYTSDNVYLKTQFPILNIKHLWMVLIYPHNVSDIENRFFKIDLCHMGGGSYVCENKEYQTKKVMYRTEGIIVYQDLINTAHNYQNFTLHYTRGSNKIEGFSRQTKVFFSYTRTTLQWLKSFAISQSSEPSLTNVVNADNHTLSFFSTLFQIEYETTASCVFSAGKADKPRNKRVVTDNQTNSWVDAYTQGNLEYQKANRFANASIMINQRASSNLIDIGDYLDDYIVYNVQYQKYANYTNVNAQAVKNYILRDYYTGVSQKVRTWVNAQDEAFVRHDLAKFYCEFSTTQATGLNYLLSPLTGYSAQPVKYVAIQTNDGTNTYPLDSSHSLLANCITRVVGNSLVLTCGFDDNWFACKVANTLGFEQGEEGKIETSDIVNATIGGTPTVFKTTLGIDKVFDSTWSGVTLKNFMYVDANGEFTSMNIKFYDTAPTINGTTIPNNNMPFADLDTTKSFFLGCITRPLAANTDLPASPVFTYNHTIHKDNKEIPMVSLQYEFCSANCDDILVTNNYVKYQKAIRTTEKTGIAFYTGNYYNRYIDTIPTGATELENGYVRFDGNAVTFYDIDEAEDYIYVCQGDEVLLVVRTEAMVDNTIYLNVRSER